MKKLESNESPSLGSHNEKDIIDSYSLDTTSQVIKKSESQKERSSLPSLPKEEINDDTICHICHAKLSYFPKFRKFW